jgi:hypothetical protein
MKNISQEYRNQGKGFSEIEGKAARVAAKELGAASEFQSRFSFPIFLILPSIPGFLAS